jgi:hypothetical protein
VTSRRARRVERLRVSPIPGSDRGIAARWHRNQVAFLARSPRQSRGWRSRRGGSATLE